MVASPVFVPHRACVRVRRLGQNRPMARTHDFRVWHITTFPYAAEFWSLSGHSGLLPAERHVDLRVHGLGKVTRVTSTILRRFDSQYSNEQMVSPEKLRVA